MQSNERVLTFTEDLQPNACLYEVHYTDYTNYSKKVMRFSCEKYETSATDSEKTSRTSKVS